MSAEYPPRRSRQADARPGVPATSSGLPRRADRRAAGNGRTSRGVAAGRPRPDLFFVVLVVLALLKAELSRVMGLGAANPIATVALESAAIVFILGAVDLIWPRRSYTLDLVAYTVLSAVMLANVVYASFFGEIFSPALLSVVGQAADVSDSIKSLLKPAYLLYLVDIPFLVAFAVALRSRKRTVRAGGRSRLVLAATGVALLVVVVQVVSVLGLSADVDSGSIAKVRGFGAYQLASLVRLTLPDPAVASVSAIERQPGVSPGRATQMRIDTIRGANTGTRIGNVKTGQFRGKNVIIIQVEALQDLVINRRYQGKTITPNLNQLAGQSWYFPNTFSQTSAGNTVDAEFTVNTSLLAPVNGAASLEYSDRVLPGLPRLLREKGYDAVTLHQNDVRFWNRKELYPALGFRRYWDLSYFLMRDKMWHASDQVLFRMGMNVLKTEEASSAPFYAQFITESSHGPFKTVPMNRRPLRLSPSDEKTYSGLYIGAISYTDLALGEFLSALKKNGMWDDSIIVVYGDHSAQLGLNIKPGDSRVADTILGRPYSDIDYQRIPLIIHLPGQTAGHVETKPAGQVDVMPTIADLLGLDLSATPHVGRSLFVNAPAFVQTRVYLPAGSFINDRVLFMPGLTFDDGSAVSVSTAAKVPATDRERQDLERAKQLSVISDAWVKTLPKRPDAGGAAGAIIPH
ncbi:MAG TPA: LTA synthase family protein [Coriobacteriia bacterium]